MAKRGVLLLISVLVCSVVADNKLPPEYKICKRSDAKANDCLRSAIELGFQKMANGIHDLGIIGFEPVIIPSATISQGTGPVQVAQKFKNFEIHNLSKTKVNKVVAKLDPKDFNMDLDIFTPELRIEADYELDGQILLLPVSGNGNCTVILEEVNMKLHLAGKSFDKKGKQYLKLDFVTLLLSPARVVYNFRNLFNGNKQLGDEINKVINERGTEVFGDVRSSYEELIAAVIKNYANNVYSKIPFENLYPN